MKPNRKRKKYDQRDKDLQAFMMARSLDEDNWKPEKLRDDLPEPRFGQGPHAKGERNDPGQK